MYDNSLNGTSRNDTAKGGLVAQVIDQIRRDLPVPRAVALQPADPRWLQVMCEAAVMPTSDALVKCCAQMRAGGVSTVTLAEIYVPLVARSLGAQWVSDDLDFRAVSVGSARLQSLLWRLSADWAQTGVLVSRARLPVLVAVPAGCQHTLGATVLVGQLRYRGISAQLDLAFDGAQSSVRPANVQYSAIFLSASGREQLDHLAKLVQKARQAYPATPILMGGNVTDQMAELQIKTGVDLVTSDLDVALAYCGFGVSDCVGARTRQVG